MDPPDKKFEFANQSYRIRKDEIWGLYVISHV